MKLNRIAGVIIAAACGALLSAAAHAEGSVLSLSHASGTYCGTQAVRISSPEGVEVYYTTDSTVPTEDSTLYDGKPVIISESTTIFAAAFVDGEAVEYGGASIGIRTASPAVSHASGSYSETITVTVSCPEGTEVYYTADGSEPTEGSRRYTRPLSVSKSCTLKFAAYADGKERSAVVTREYTISSDVYSEPLRQQLFELVNETRAAYGLSPLEEMAQLSDIAQLRAKECGSYFSHWRPNGTKWDSLLAAEGLKRDVRAENIAYYYTTAKAVLNNWLSSSYHRANILNPDAKYIGIGHYDNGCCDYWTQIFIGDE